MLPLAGELSWVPAWLAVSSHDDTHVSWVSAWSSSTLSLLSEETGHLGLFRVFFLGCRLCFLELKVDSWNSELHCCGRHPRGQVPGPWTHPYYLEFHGMKLLSVVMTPSLHIVYFLKQSSKGWFVSCFGLLFLGVQRLVSIKRNKKQSNHRLKDVLY